MKRNPAIIWLVVFFAAMILSVPIVHAAVFQKRVSAGEDDAEENLTAGSVSISSSDLELINDGTDQRVGIRFSGIEIPKGATVTKAYIQFTAHETSAGSGTLSIRCQAADNAPAFTTTQYDITSRPRTIQNVLWSPPAWNAGQAGENQRTPDLSAIIMEILSRPGWTSNNAIAFIVTGTTNFKRVAKAYNVSPSQAPLLFVEFTSGSPYGILERRVNAGNDDAEENLVTGSVSISSSDLELINDGTDQRVGVRFKEIGLPKNTVVTRAYIQFTAHETSAGSGTLSLRCQAADNAPAFTTTQYDITSRPRTSINVLWSPAAWNAGQAGENQRTPDLSAIIMEILSRPGWTSNNAIAFIVTGTTNFKRVAKAYNVSPSQAPLLHIEYSLKTAYYGHLHNHTCYSDGRGDKDNCKSEGKFDPAKAYDYARNTAKLDFFGIADHAEQLSEVEWDDLKRTAASKNSDNVFVAFHGFEWTSHFPVNDPKINWGHVAVINTADITKAKASSDNSFQITETFDKLVTWLSTRSGVAFLNHPGDCNQDNKEFNHFDSTPSAKFVGMELWNKSNGFSEYYYKDGYYLNDGGRGFFDEALKRGWIIGAAGSGDDHNGTWGTAQPYRLGVWANTLTKFSIFTALQERSFFSTLDANLRLWFDINGTPMGGTLTSGTKVARIVGFDPSRNDKGELKEKIKIVELLKGSGQNFEVPYAFWVPNSPFFRYELPNLTCKAGDYFYVRVKEEDGGEAISSPIWIK